MFLDDLSLKGKVAIVTGAKMAACIPMGRVGKLYELGYLATFLSSPASDFITGQIVFIDGGCLQFSPYKCK